MITRGVSFGGFIRKSKRVIKGLLFSKSFGWSGGIFLPSSNEIPLQDFKETVVLNGHNGILPSIKQFLIEDNKNYDVGAFNSGLNKVSYQFNGSTIVYL